MEVVPVAVDMSDLHIKKDNIPVIIGLFEQAIYICKNTGVKVIIFKGDMFTERDKQSLECLEAVMRCLDMVREADLAIVGIHGNHDQKDQNSDLSYLSLYRHNESLNLASAPASLEIVKGQLFYHFVGYYQDNDLYKQKLKIVKENYDKRGKNILFTHKAFNGVRNNDGSLVLDGIHPEEVEMFDAVHVGHYHDRSVVGDNIYYDGATLQHNFGEHPDKGFTLHYSDGTFEYLPASFPVYKHVKFKVTNVEETLTELAEAIESIQPNQYVRYTFEASTEDLAQLPLAVLKDSGIDVKSERKDLLTTDFEEIQDYTIMKYDTKSLLQAYIEYSKLQNFTPKQRAGGLLRLKNLKQNVVID